MNKQVVAAVIFSLAGVSVALAQVPYSVPYPPPPPPPPYAYPAPAPYPPPTSPLFFFPPDAGPYLQIQAGPTFYQDGRLTTWGGPTSATVHYDTGGSVDVDVGYAFNKYIAAGFEVGFNGTSISSIPGYYLSSADFYNFPFLANVTFTYPIPHSFVTPYIGGGVGGSDSVFNPSQMSDGNTTVVGEADEVVFAWEAYAGLRFSLSPNMAIGIGYKYFGTGDPNFSYPPSPNFNVGFRGVQTHSIMASFNWRF